MVTPAHLLGPDEPQRLAALQAYRVAGNAPFFDEFVRLTGKLFQVPSALVSLVESDTVWFRGNAGLKGVPERVPRGASLCAVAVLSDETTMFQDLADRPYVLIDPTAVADLGLRLYAGFPLLTPAGDAVGTLCVIDRQPRFLQPEEAARRGPAGAAAAPRQSARPPWPRPHAVRGPLSGKDRRARTDSAAPGGRSHLGALGWPAAHPTQQERSRWLKALGRTLGWEREFVEHSFSGKVRHERVMPVWQAVTTHTARNTGAGRLILGSEGDQTLKEIALGHVSASIYSCATLERYGPQLLQAWAAALG